MATVSIAVLLWIWSAMGPLAQEAAPASLLDRVLESGEVRIGTTGDYPPYTELNEGSGVFEGLDIDLARNLAQSLGVKPVFVQTTWPTLMDDMASGRFDIAMGGISRTLKRQRSVYFSIPYRRFGKTPIARCDDRTRFDSLADIDRPGVRVIVNPGGTNEIFAREHLKQADLSVYPDNRTIFTEIVEGRADVMITDSDEVLYQQRINPALCGTMPGNTFTKSEKAYPMPRDITWKLYVDTWLQQLRLEGELDRTISTYFGE